MNRIIAIILFHLSLSASCALAEENTCWKNNKLTPDQPFPAQVIAIQCLGWEGYYIYLQSLDKKDDYCIAHANLMKVTYTKLAKNDPKTPTPGKGGIYATTNGWIFITPGIHVNKFSWSMGGMPLGASIDNDQIKKAYKINLSQKKDAEQNGADQPTIAPDSKTEGNEKPRTVKPKKMQNKAPQTNR